jgi:uncharacterized membrane protein YhiD involved in acid resistance
LSFLAGGLIGFERSSRRQVAGLRTHILICVGATLLMLLSVWIPQTLMQGRVGDPGRIAAQVVSGIGFLGAGAILRLGNNVKGLTTAASLWLISAVGLAIGAGMYLAAGVALFLSMFTLMALDRLEKRLFPVERNKVLDISFKESVPDTKKAWRFWSSSASGSRASTWSSTWARAAIPASGSWWASPPRRTAEALQSPEGHRSGGSDRGQGKVLILDQSGRVASSNSARYRNAYSLHSPHISRDALSDRRPGPLGLAVEAAAHILQQMGTGHSRGLSSGKEGEGTGYRWGDAAGAAARPALEVRRRQWRFSAGIAGSEREIVIGKSQGSRGIASPSI